MKKGQIRFQLKNEEEILKICRSIRKNGELQSVYAISYKVEISAQVQIEMSIPLEALATVIMNFQSDGIEEYGSLALSLDRGNIQFKPKKLEIDIKHRESPLAKPSIRRPQN